MDQSGFTSGQFNKRAEFCDSCDLCRDSVSMHVYVSMDAPDRVKTSAHEFVVLLFIFRRGVKTFLRVI